MLASDRLTSIPNRTLHSASHSGIAHLPFGTVPFGTLALAIRKITADHCRASLGTQKLASNLFKSSNLPKLKIQNRIGRLHLAESTGRVESDFEGFKTATERSPERTAPMLKVLEVYSVQKSDLQKAANLPVQKAHSKRNYLNEMN